jgi:hypothetical protein
VNSVLGQQGSSDECVVLFVAYHGDERSRILRADSKCNETVDLTPNQARPVGVLITAWRA